MVYVNYFLGCVKLETGGIIIAWLHVIYYVIAVFASIVGMAMLTFSGGIVRPSVQVISSVSILVLLSVTLFIVIVLIAYRSIKAIKARSHTLIYPMMAMMFALACLSLYTVFIQFWLTPAKMIPACISFLLYFYFSIVIYSLYRVFRKEYEHILLEQEKACA